MNALALVSLLHVAAIEPVGSSDPSAATVSEPEPPATEVAGSEPTTPDPDRAPDEDVPDAIEAPDDVTPAPVELEPNPPKPVTPAPQITAAAAEPEKPIDPKKDPTDIETSRYVPGKGVEFATKNGNFSVQLRARIQVLYDLGHPNVDGEATEQAMLIRRARLQLQGNVFGKHNRYYMQIGFSPRDQIGGVVAADGSIRRTPLRDARLEFDYLRDFTIFVGQMKIPFSRQRVISSGNLNLVDRGLINEEFQLDRDIGLQALSKDVGGMGWLAYNAGVFMGEGRNTFEPSSVHMLYVARIEFLPFGKFEDYSEADLERSKKPGMSIGGAYVFHDNAPGDRGTHGSVPADGGTTDFHNATGDIFFKWYGASLHTAFHWRQGFNRVSGGAVDDDGALIPTVDPRNGIGWFAQPGFVVPKIPLEIVARYGLVRRNAGSMTWKDELGGGINYYIAGHNLKVQLDYTRLWGGDTGNTPTRALQSGTDRIRLQVQLAF